MSNLFGDHVDEIEGVRVGELLLRQNGLLFDIDWWKSIKQRDKKLNINRTFYFKIGLT